MNPLQNNLIPNPIDSASVQITLETTNSANNGSITSGVLVHKKACKNCFKLHRKCNKQMPCDYCSLRGKPCEINPCIKKRGRPLGSTNKAKTKEEKEAKKQKKLGRPKKPKVPKQEKPEKEKISIVPSKIIKSDMQVSKEPEYTFNVDTFTSTPINAACNSKQCHSCLASVISTAKFCTNCGHTMDELQSSDLLNKLDTERWKNTILEQKLFKFDNESSNGDKKSSNFPVAPSLASWDFSHIENLPLFPGLGSNNNSFSLTSNINNLSNSNLPALRPSVTRTSASSVFDFVEPTIFLDSSVYSSDQMMNWAISYEQNFKKEFNNEDQQNNSNSSSSSIIPFQNNDIPLFREHFEHPKF